MHRADGKKLPFVNGVLKSTIQEDIDYLRQEAHVHENPYIREAEGGEIDLIESVLNPRQAMKEQVTKELEAEIEARVRAQVEAEFAQRQKLNVGQMAGIDGAKNKMVPPAAGEDVKLAPLPPGLVLGAVNSSQLMGGAASSDSANSENAAAAASARLASLKASK
jgi:hypothetical protein